MTGNHNSTSLPMPSPADTIISLSGISFIRQYREILHDIDLKVSRGDFIAITGPNGGGKTTLLRIMLRLVKPTAGKVEYYDNGTTVDNLSIGYLPQKNMIDSRFPITVRQVVSSGLLSRGHIDREQERRLTDETISLMGLEQKAEATIGVLSGGQLQRTLLGRALISRPSILVLDEPLSYIDKKFEYQIYDIISSLAKDTTIVLVSHEMSRISSMANRHVIIDRTLTECDPDNESFAMP